MIENLIGTKETVNYYNSVGIRIYDNNAVEDYPLHWHGDTEIIMPIVNEYYYDIDGETKILLPKEILIIPPGQLHSLSAPSSGRRLIILFDTSLINTFKEFSSFLFNIRPFIVISKDVFGESANELANILKEVNEEYNSNFAYNEALCYSFLIKFLALLARNNTAKTLESFKQKNNYTSNHYKTISTICNYINNNCSEKLKIEDLAEIAGYSVFHFSRLFKEYNNETVYNYITKRRVMQAEKLLLKPDLSIMQVATQSGFDSISTFNRVFKQQKKCTPSQFIALNTSEYNK